MRAIAKVVLALGACWLAGSLAFLIFEAILSRGFDFAVDVPEPLRSLLSFGPWCGGPALLVLSGLYLAMSKNVRQPPERRL
jgi:hypothetical protein